MTTLRGTKRRLDLESESSEPAETLTTDASFLTAESDFGEDSYEDMTEVSSPGKPGKVRKWSKKTERLNEGGGISQNYLLLHFPHVNIPHVNILPLSLVCADAATFAKARTLVMHAGHKAAGPSQREQRAQLRAQRLEQKTAQAHGAEEEDDVLHDADANELEAAASLVNLMAHEARQATGTKRLCLDMLLEWSAVACAV